MYLHIPYCQVRCAYCDFNTYAGLDGLMPAYAAALARELRLVGAGCPADVSVHTVFFGGGTPSLLPLALYEDIFAALRSSFSLAADCEITLEANPGTVDGAYLDGLRRLGVNRLSFGVQSSHASELKLLDRLHSFDDVIQAVRLGRAAGFDDANGGLNLDLIFALPHQTLPMWQATLARVLALAPEHLSLYALSLENGTPLRSWVQRGLLPLPDPDLAAEMYALASDTLAAEGYEQYEISNWARERKLEAGSWTLDGGRSQVLGASLVPPPSSFHHPISSLQPLASSFQCKHNLQYWRNGPYLGLGAGAHGGLPGSWLARAGGAGGAEGVVAGSDGEGWRYSNALAPAAYIERLEGNDRRGAEAVFPFSPAMLQKTRVSPEDERNETMMLGMRLTREGVRADCFEARFGLPLAAAFPRQLRRLRDLGLIEWDNDGARLTPGGRLLGNRVFREFV